MLHPNVVVAEAILSAIRSGLVGEAIDLGEGYGIVCLTVEQGSPLDGRSLAGVCLVLLVQVSPEGEMAVAHGGHVVREGQRIVVAAPKGDNRVLRLFGER